MTSPDLWGDVDADVAHPLIGQRVAVTIARAGDHIEHWHPGEPEPERLTKDVVIAGVLRSLKAGGDAAVEQDNGDVLYCWPALDIQPSTTAQSNVTGT